MRPVKNSETFFGSGCNCYVRYLLLIVMYVLVGTSKMNQRINGRHKEYLLYVKMYVLPALCTSTVVCVNKCSDLNITPPLTHDPSPV